MSTRLKVGIVGASGYSGEVLVRLLARHPRVELAAVTSRSLAGTPVAEVMPAMRGQLGGLTFTASDPVALALTDIDLYFLALPHGVAADYARALVDAGKQVIDLSADFRLSSPETYREYYGQDHPAPDLLEQAVYVIPELAKSDAWKSAQLIANPGCYPTSIIVPLAPLLAGGIVKPNGIVANAMSGVSGAGKKATEFYSFSERVGNVVAYGLPKHRHLSEIEEQLASAAGEPVVMQFHPHLIPVKAGIAATMSAPANGKTLDELYACWFAAYPDKPFVQILPSGTHPETAHVVGTNRVDMSAVYDARTDHFIITSAEDNLIKGASGQAVQTMNLWHGFAETDGLL